MNIDVHKAMLNSYYLIIRDYDPFLLITQGDGVFAHNPSGELDREEIENMLLYFEDEEDYDKCREIVEFINRTWSLENTKKK